MQNISELTPHEELSIRILEFCKNYPMCRFDLRVNYKMLTPSAARVFNHLFKKQGKVYPSDYLLLRYISTLEILDEYLVSSNSVDDAFVGEIISVDGEEMRAVANMPIRGDAATLRLRQSMIKDALCLFNYAIYDLKQLQLRTAA